jgi:hypothetical protein
MSAMDILAGVIAFLLSVVLQIRELRMNPRLTSVIISRLVIAELACFMACTLIGASYVAVTGWAGMRLAGTVTVSAVVAALFGILILTLSLEQRGGSLSRCTRRVFCRKIHAAE